VAQTKVIGLVGPIGAGKTTLAKCLAKRGGPIFNADKAAHAVLNKPTVVRKLVRRWGNGIARAGKIVRSKLAKIVFTDGDERLFLEGVIHPPVITETKRFIEDAGRKKKLFVVIDAPLLMESGMEKLCDFIVYVDAPKSVRIGRALNLKGLDADEIARRERAMMALGTKRKKAARIIRNNGDLDSLQKRADRFLEDFVNK